MNPWVVLEIEVTSDEKVIKKAYAKKLKLCNPEDDPEKFMLLRNAYESALKYSKHKNIKTIEKNTELISENNKDLCKEIIEDLFRGNDIENFMLRFRSLYNDFFKRLDIENWKRLFSEDSYEGIYMDIEKSLELDKKILGFLKINNNLPDYIWEFLSEQFLWSEREDLHKYFSYEFTDMLKNKAYFRCCYSYKHFRKDEDFDYDKFIDLRKNAQNRLSNLDLEKAISLINEAKGLFDKDPDLTRLEGQYYIRIKDYDKGIEAFTRLIQLIPDEIDGYIYRATLLKKKKDFKKAYYDYRKVLEIDEDNIDASIGIAIYFISINKNFEAKYILEGLKEDYPHYINISVYLYKAIYSIINELESSKENVFYYEKALELAEFYYDMDDYDESIIWIEKILEKGIEEEHIYKIYGLIKKKQEDMKGAIKAFGKAISLAEYKESITYLVKQRGICYKKLKKYELAKKDFSKVLYINPDDDEALYEISDSYRFLDDLDKALYYINKAIEINDNNWIYFSERALCYYDMKIYDKSLEDHKIVLKAEPDFSSALYRTGFCQLKLKEYGEALKSFKRASEEGSTLSWYYMAYICLEIDYMENAKKYIENDLKEYENYRVGYILAGDICRRLGEYEEAIDYYKKGAEINGYYSKDYIHIGYTYVALKNYKKALKELRNFEGYEDSNIVMDIIWLSIYENDLESALLYIDLYEELVEDKNPAFILYKGIVQYKLGSKIEAARLFEKSIKTNSSSEGFSYLSMIFYEKGDIKGALKLAEKAVEVDPENDIFRRRLEDIKKYKELNTSMKVQNFKDEFEKVDLLLGHKFYKLSKINVNIGD